MAGADRTWSIEIQCSRSTDVTSPSLTNRMFIDTLTASFFGNVTLFQLPKNPVSNNSVHFSVTYNMYTNTYIEHICKFNGLQGTRCSSTSCVLYNYKQNICCLRKIKFCVDYPKTHANKRKKCRLLAQIGRMQLLANHWHSLLVATVQYVC